MKNKIFSLILLIPILFAGCDNLFDKGDVEKTYEGPDQIAFFPLQDNNDLGVNVTSTSIQLQYISEKGLAASDIPISFEVVGASTSALDPEHYSITSTTATIASGNNTVDFTVDFVVTTVDDNGISVAETALDSNRVFASYTDLTATAASGGTGALFDVTIPEFGAIADVDTIGAGDPARLVGEYLGVTATGGTAGSGATFDVVVPEYGEILTIDSLSAYDATRTPGTYNVVSATGGSGTEATFNVVIDDTAAVTVSILFAGSKYDVGDDLTIPAASIGGTGADLTFEVGTISVLTSPTITVATAGLRYQDNAGEAFTIAAADLGGAGADLTFQLNGVSASGKPIITLAVDEKGTPLDTSDDTYVGGTGYANNDVLTIPAADLGGVGADLSFTLVELTGSFFNEGIDEVVLVLDLSAGNTLQMAENLKSTTIFMAK